MNNLKLGVLACGVLGLIGCFLPFVSMGDESMSFFAMRQVDAGQVYMVMVGYVAAAAMGGMAMAKAPMLRWQSIVALVGFAFVAFKFRGGFMDMLTHGAIGAKLMWVGAVAGLVLSGLTIAKPEQAK
jgi:hypothetical protein